MGLYHSVEFCGYTPSQNHTPFLPKPVSKVGPETVLNFTSVLHIETAKELSIGQENWFLSGTNQEPFASGAGGRITVTNKTNYSLVVKIRLSFIGFL